MSTDLPSKPNLRHLKKRAKDLHKSFQAGDASVCVPLREHLPRLADLPPEEIFVGCASRNVSDRPAFRRR